MASSVCLVYKVLEDYKGVQTMPDSHFGHFRHFIDDYFVDRTDMKKKDEEAGGDCF